MFHYLCGMENKQIMKNAQNTSQSIGGQFYNALFAHCSKQYKNIAIIKTAYIVNKQVYAIDYIDHKGIMSISNGVANVISDKIINFK